MRNLLSTVKKALTGSVIAATLMAFPLATSGIAAADSNDANDPPCVAPTTDAPGVHSPTGSDASQFVYQCKGIYAGDWLSTYYIFDTTTGQRTARYDPDFQYNCITNVWTMTEWDYSPAQGAYVQSRVTANPAPNLPTGCPVAPSGSPQGGMGGSGTASSTGPGSTNTINGNTTLNASTSTNTTLGMSNTIYSQASTGIAFVVGNTSAGNATSGNAQSIANIANLLQSTSNVFGTGTITFVANIDGDVNGDFMFDPSALISSTGPGSTNTTGNNLQINTTDTNNTNAHIANNIDVGATSGDATVANNTSGGNATSGNAQAIVNLMNLINSTVSAGHSFVGVVNINGNLNGDILLPQSFIDQLLASTGPNSTNTANTDITDNSMTANNTTEGIANNVISSAQSGDATVANNTGGGNATSGQTGTNVTILNLTGSNVIGSNDLLVFVNVLGHWIGMIVNAPVGSTAASLGGGISGTGPGSTNASSQTVTDNSATTNNTTEGITNDVKVHAKSGDASVTDNTQGGNATSGDAFTAVNILNIAGSNLNLSNWFGVLFINVFGDWNGSFGVNTSAGDPMPAGSNSGPDSSGRQPTPHTATTVTRPFASFQATTENNGQSPATQSNATLAAILGAQTNKKAATTALPTPDNATHTDYLLPAIGVTIAAVMLIGERVAAWYGKHHSV